MYCKNCGNAMDELDNFCRVCGSKACAGEAPAYKISDDSEERHEESFDLSRFLVFDEKKENEHKKIDEEYENLKSKIFGGESSESNHAYNKINYEEDDDEDAEANNFYKSKSPAKKIFLLFAIVAFAVISAAGIRYLLVEKGWLSVTADFQSQTEKNTNTAEGADDAVTTDAGTAEVKEQDRSIPAADKTKLIESLAYLNHNIAEIKANDSLKYDPEKKYAVDDIGNSKPLTDNLWFEKDGKKYYYDEAVIGTLISFNSQWIDFVNDGDKSVLDLTKKDGRAYKNIVNFKRKNIKEEFELFEIGEIRKGEKDFYVWTHEKINATKNSRTETREYHYIYRLEPGETDFKIVSYYKY